MPSQAPDGVIMFTLWRQAAPQTFENQNCPIFQNQEKKTLRIFRGFD